jgi:DNA-binding response OmpR family regulator
LLHQIPSVKTGEPRLEFLVVCNDANAFKVLTEVIRNLHGRLNCASSAGAAMDYLTRRKVDGIVIDMKIPGAMDLVACVRTCNSNKLSVVFAYIDSAQEAKIALQAGANFVWNRPLNAQVVADSFKAAARMMVAERRRFFRYPLMLPVELKVNGVCEDATMANLSEGGMAIWNLRSHVPTTELEFSFSLPFGGHIQGHGEIAWTNGEGSLGIRFHILPDRAYTYLFSWLNRRDRFMFRRPAV